MDWDAYNRGFDNGYESGYEKGRNSTLCGKVMLFIHRQWWAWFK